jgi:hypothetical protein
MTTVEGRSSARVCYESRLEGYASLCIREGWKNSVMIVRDPPNDMRSAYNGGNFKIWALSLTFQNQSAHCLAVHEQPEARKKYCGWKQSHGDLRKGDSSIRFLREMQGQPIAGAT